MFILNVSGSGGLGRCLNWGTDKIFATVVIRNDEEQLVISKTPPSNLLHAHGGVRHGPDFLRGNLKLKPWRYRPIGEVLAHPVFAKAEHHLALKKDGPSEHPSQEDALLARIHKESEMAKKKFLSTGLVLPAGEFQDALEISREAISKARESGRIFVVPMPNGVEYYPSFFVSKARKGMKAISKRLGLLDGWSKWAFFTTPKDSLGGATPIEALEGGPQAEVDRAADRGISALEQ